MICKPHSSVVPPCNLALPYLVSALRFGYSLSIAFKETRCVYFLPPMLQYSFVPFAEASERL